MREPKKTNEVVDSNAPAESVVGATDEPQVIDPNDPLHDSIESVLAGLSPRERALKLDEMFSPKNAND